MRQEKMNLVPLATLGKIVAGFAADGASQIVVVPDGSGTYTVTANFE